MIPLIGVNHHQPILHMSKIMVHFYSTDESINQFTIGYIINPYLNCNKVFREQVEKWLSFTFHDRAIKTIEEYMRKKNTCFMALIMFYDNIGVKPKKCIEC